jgi:DNA-directed RNA polymerase subunit RPC12/RpoP
MMMKKLDKKVSEAYKLDIASISEDGSFQCPKCGTTISPDDEPGEKYQIIEPDLKINNENELVGLTIVCGKCGSKIELSAI